MLDGLWAVTRKGACQNGLPQVTRVLGMKRLLQRRPADTRLEGAVVPLELAAQALQLAAGQDGLAVLALQVVLLLHQLRLLLLQDLHLLLGVTVLLQLGQGSKGHRCSRAEQGNAPCAEEETRESRKCSEGGQELYNAKDASFERSRTATEPKDPQAGPISFLNSRPGESE